MNILSEIARREGIEAALKAYDAGMNLPVLKDVNGCFANSITCRACEDASRWPGRASCNSVMSTH